MAFWRNNPNIFVAGATGGQISGTLGIYGNTQIGLIAPTSPTGTPSATGGTVAAGNYLAKVVALDASGSVVGAESASVTAAGATASIAWAWNTVAGATSYQLWPTPTNGAANSENNYFASSTNSFLQTVTAGTAGTIPASDTSGSLTVGSGAAGLVIRPFTSGGYGAIYSAGITPSNSNYAFAVNGSNSFLNVGAGGTVGLTVNSAGVLFAVSTGVAVTGTLSSTGTMKPLVTTVALLPAAATAGVGAGAFVTDANATFVLGLGVAAVGGGANKVPVYSDGTNWIVG